MLSVISSCSKDTETDAPQPPQTQMNGKILLINQFGDTLNDARGVSVYSNGKLQSITQENGNYTIYGLSSHEAYNLAFTADHIGDLRYHNYVFVDKGTVEDICLTEFSNSKADTIYYYPGTNYAVDVAYYGVHDLRPEDRFVRAYFDTLPSVSPSQYTFTRKSAYRAIEGRRNYAWVLETEWDYNSYDTVYVRLYGVSSLLVNYNTYTHPETGLMVDPGVNPDITESLFIAVPIYDLKRENK